MSIWERNPEQVILRHKYGKQRIAILNCQTKKCGMKKLLPAILLFYFSFFSCSKPRLCACIPVPQSIVKAVVVQENNIDCNRPVILIDPTDTAIVNRITGIHTDTYVANQLPATLKKVSQKLFVEIGFLTAAEDFTCTTIGPSYAHIKVITAVERN